MENDSGIFLTAFGLILSRDADLIEIVALSLSVTLSATLLAALIGLPLGALLGAFRFVGRTPIIIALNALMSLPPVVVGLSVYLLLSASGPLGPMGLLYTPTAMIIAQTILITPIIAALTRQVTEDLNREYAEHFASLMVPARARIAALLWDARASLLTIALAGFGRAMAEVGAVMIVGGNINHVTRTMTTTIALETSRGNLELALALGIVLMALALIISSVVMSLRATSPLAAHA